MASIHFINDCITRAFLALLHHHRPEMVDLSKMEEEDTVTNCSKAFAIAEVGCWDHCGKDHLDQMHLLYPLYL